MLIQRRIASLVLVGLLCLGAFGCTKEAPQSTAPHPTSGPPAGGGGGNATKRYKVVFIPKSTGNPYFDDVDKGFKKAGEELGFDYETVGPANANPDSQIAIIKQQTQQQVDAIAISPNSPDIVKPALQEARAKGIKVICIDADLTGNEDGRDAGVLPMDFNITGKSQIELMGELMGYQGEFAILSATDNAPNQNFWIKGMQETLKDPKYKDMKLVEIVYGDDDQQKSTTKAQGLLTKYPNLKGILAPTSVGIAAVAQVVQTKGAADHVAVTGLGMPNLMRRYVEDGTVKKFALWSPSDMGYLGGHLLIGLLKGEIKPATGVTFKAGTLGERKFEDKNVIITGPPLVFEKSNIDQYKF